MTFFITRPPERTTRPPPSTKRAPIRLSRQPPARTRRGPEAPVATAPPTVGSPSVPISARWSIGSNGSAWPCSASAASISAMGVPAAATSVRAPGSWSAMPDSRAVDRTAAPSGTGTRVPPPRTHSGPAASRTASASAASEAGSITPPAGP